MAELPADLQQIRTVEDGRRPADWAYVRHTVQFSYGTGETQTDLAEFTAQGPLPFPVLGQVVSLHGVYVKVTEVDVAYEATENGAPAVFASVRVDSVDLFPAASDPGSGT